MSTTANKVTNPMKVITGPDTRWSYQEYRAYCQRNGEYARSTTDFYAGLEKAGFIRRKTKAGMVISGIQLKSDFLE